MIIGINGRIYRGLGLLLLGRVYLRGCDRCIDSFKITEMNFSKSLKVIRGLWPHGSIEDIGIVDHCNNTSISHRIRDTATYIGRESCNFHAFSIWGPKHSWDDPVQI